MDSKWRRKESAMRRAPGLMIKRITIEVSCSHGSDGNTLAIRETAIVVAPSLLLLEGKKTFFFVLLCAVRHEVYDISCRFLLRDGRVGVFFQQSRTRRRL